jgi:hypothetical protein
LTKMIRTVVLRSSRQVLVYRAVNYRTFYVSSIANRGAATESLKKAADKLNRAAGFAAAKGIDAAEAAEHGAEQAVKVTASGASKLNLAAGRAAAKGIDVAESLEHGVENAAKATVSGVSKLNLAAGRAAAKGIDIAENVEHGVEHAASSAATGAHTLNLAAGRAAAKGIDIAEDLEHSAEHAAAAAARGAHILNMAAGYAVLKGIDFAEAVGHTARIAAEVTKHASDATTNILHLSEDEAQRPLEYESRFPEGVGRSAWVGATSAAEEDVQDQTPSRINGEEMKEETLTRDKEQK